MSIYQSVRQFNEFFEDPGSRKYEKYRNDPRAEVIYDCLQARIDWLISSIRNHRKPALQGVIEDLENILIEEFQWTRDQKENFFITMIGMMVRFLVEEHGFIVKRTRVPLRYNRIISTAATYQLQQ